MTLSVRVPESILASLFDAWGVWDVAETLHLDVPPTDPPRGDEITRGRLCSFAGSISYYGRASSNTCWNAARIHYVRCDFGEVIGRWPKSLLLDDDIVLFREGHTYE